MSLTIDRCDQVGKTTIELGGELDTTTAPLMRPVIEQLAGSPPLMLVLDLHQLDYISSAGLRCIFQLKKIMKTTDGELVISRPSEQVRKVFEIVKAVPIQSVFSSTEELDAYLDRMQRKVGHHD
ncbi:MAG: STAS domain-containing protein [Pseudomonadota bacterium]